MKKFDIKKTAVMRFVKNYLVNKCRRPGTSAAGGQLSITAAYTKAPAKEISVYDYTQVLFAAVLGLIFFQQIPDLLSICGYVLIIGSAVYKWIATNRINME